eukprot:6184648-Pleurochrysis_carterae.AAC.1
MPCEHACRLLSSYLWQNIRTQTPFSAQLSEVTVKLRPECQRCPCNSLRKPFPGTGLENGTNQPALTCLRFVMQNHYGNIAKLFGGAGNCSYRRTSSPNAIPDALSAKAEGGRGSASSWSRAMDTIQLRELASAAKVKL